MACHKKCEKLTGNLCGLNQKLVAEALQALKKGESSVPTRCKQQSTKKKKKKKKTRLVDASLNQTVSLFSKRNLLFSSRKFDLERWPCRARSWLTQGVAIINPFTPAR